MTIKDLSSLTGYSVGTISRVLNDQPNVSQKARDVILQAVADSGFQLNTNAKQLKQQHSNSILVMVKGTRNELFSVMVEAIQGHFSALKHPLIVDYLDEDQNEVARAAQLCPEKKPLGILFLGGNYRNFQSHFSRIDVPCVLVTNSAESWHFDNLSSVSTDDFAASQAAMDALIRQGHRSIAMIGGKYDGSDTSRLRYQGCLSSLMAQGIDFNPQHDYEAVRFSYQDGYDATCRLLHKGKKYTAVFAVADVLAIGAIRALRDHGLNVPQDVSVMGFDGLPLGDFLVPKLSTVNQSVLAMAQRSVQILLAAIEKDEPARHETIPYILKLRESTQEITK